MTDLAIRSTEVSDRVGDVLDILADDNASLEDWIAAFAVGQQIRLKVDRALKARRDDIIVAMERSGTKALGPLSIKSTAVDPSYPANDRENWLDASVQDGLAALRERPDTRPYVRIVPAHLEIAVDVLAQDIQLGVATAIELYREMNRRGWRKEAKERRKSLAVREPRKKDAA
jgi:hypothetical protein